MPWSETSPMDQRTQFIADYLGQSLIVTELCDLYGVSRKTGYKWIGRYLRSGPAGLEERSRGREPLRRWRGGRSPSLGSPVLVSSWMEHASFEQDQRRAGARHHGKEQQMSRI